MVAAYSGNADDRGDEVVGLRVFRGGGSGPVWKRFRLNRKTPCTPRGDIGSFSSTCIFRSSYA